MAEKKKAAKKYKRVVYCERCGHPADRHIEEGCTAPTTKKGSPQCKCPRMVFPVGGYMATMGQRATQERARTSDLPPPFEPPDEKRRRS